MDELEEWVSIKEFPGYSISSLGRVRNNRSGSLMTMLRNQWDVVNVGLTKDRRQYKRSVALLVAQAFLPNPSLPNFNTPIHLNGDPTDCRVSNLMWRPRWFAVKYHQQFNHDKRWLSGPIRERHTGETFPNSWEAATKYGLLDKEINLAIMNRTYVSPTFQIFEEVSS